MQESALIRENGVSREELESSIDALLAQYPDIKKLLIVPPDLTRCHSYAGEITKILWNRLHDTVHIDIIPALGTHMALTREEQISFFGEDIPEDAFIVHHWQTDTVKLGTVPSSLTKELSDGRFVEDIAVEVNHLLVDGGYDLILSVGQVVPHEVVGMANYSKNIFVGLGGREMLNKAHMLSAVCGVEKTLGVRDTAARCVYDYAQQHYVDGKIPLVYILTVMQQTENDLTMLGLFIGETRKPFEQAVELSQKHNIIHTGRRAKKVVAYLAPDELKTVWVGNKGIYRTRMMIEDGGELLLLAPGVQAFGEGEEIDAMMRKTGYRNSNELIDMYHEGFFGESSMAASHLIISTSDGRFKITYATKPELMNKEDFESVYLDWMDYNEAIKRYDPDKLAPGWNTMPDGEEIYYVPTPALGLWKE